MGRGIEENGRATVATEVVVVVDAVRTGFGRRAFLVVVVVVVVCSDVGHVLVQHDVFRRERRGNRRKKIILVVVVVAVVCRLVPDQPPLLASLLLLLSVGSVDHGHAQKARERPRKLVPVDDRRRFDVEVGMGRLRDERQESVRSGRARSVVRPFCTRAKSSRGTVTRLRLPQASARSRRPLVARVSKFSASSSGGGVVPGWSERSLVRMVELPTP